jgi:hypothetical protein
MAFPWVALAIGASTAVSYMGSLQTSKNIKAGAAWDKYYKDILKDTVKEYQNKVKTLRRGLLQKIIMVL